MMVTLYYTYWSEYQKKVVRQKTSEKTIFHCAEKIIYYSENTENENMLFISLIILNTSNIIYHNLIQDYFHVQYKLKITVLFIKLIYFLYKVFRLTSNLHFQFITFLVYPGHSLNDNIYFFLGHWPFHLWFQETRVYWSNNTVSWKRTKRYISYCKMGWKRIYWPWGSTCIVIWSGNRCVSFITTLSVL